MKTCEPNEGLGVRRAAQRRFTLCAAGCVVTHPHFILWASRADCMRRVRSLQGQSAAAQSCQLLLHCGSVQLCWCLACRHACMDCKVTPKQPLHADWKATHASACDPDMMFLCFAPQAWPDRSLRLAAVEGTCEGTRASLHLPRLSRILCSELLASFSKTAGITLCGAFLLP